MYTCTNCLLCVVFYVLFICVVLLKIKSNLNLPVQSSSDREVIIKFVFSCIPILLGNRLLAAWLTKKTTAWYILRFLMWFFFVVKINSVHAIN